MNPAIIDRYALVIYHLDSIGKIEGFAMHITDAATGFFDDNRASDMVSNKISSRAKIFVDFFRGNAQQ